MPFPAYCAQNHASTEQELEVISFAIHIHVKPEHSAAGLESPSGGSGGLHSSSMLLGRTAAAHLAEQTGRQGCSKPRPGLADGLEHTASDQDCGPGTPSSTCSPASPRSTLSSASSTQSSGRELQIRLVRSSFQPLGLRLAADPEAWEILSLETGLVQEWNKENPQQMLLPGDFIMSINGEDTTVGMECAMASDPTLELKIWRPRRSYKVSL